MHPAVNPGESDEKIVRITRKMMPLRALLADKNLDSQTASRLSVYEEISFEGFFDLLRSIRFISCCKEHELDTGNLTVSKCKIRAINGRCGHQRTFKDLSDRNAATVVDDAMLFAKAFGFADLESANRTLEATKNVRRSLQLLDFDAAIGRSMFDSSETAAKPLAGNTFTLQQLRGYLRTEEEVRGKPLEHLTQLAIDTYERIETELERVSH